MSWIRDRIISNIPDEGVSYEDIYQLEKEIKERFEKEIDEWFDLECSYDSYVLKEFTCDSDSIESLKKKLLGLGEKDEN